MVAARCLPFMGGIETHVEEVAGRIAARGVSLRVLTTDPTGTLPAREDRPGYRLERFRAYPAGRDYYVSPGLARALGEAEVDLVHVQGVHSAVPPLALAVAQRRGVPAVVSFHTGGHSSPLRTALREAQWRLEAPLLRRAARLVAVCEFEVGQFSRRLGVPPEQIRLVRNGSEPLPVGAGAPVATGSPLVCSIGRLERYKGHHLVIQAMPDLLAQAPGARLVVVGHGPFETDLRALATRLGVAGSVEFTSFDKGARSAMGALVAAADVVTLMSEYEAHPVAVMEALAAGVDVVVADTSGMSELGRAGLVDLVDLGAPPGTLARALLAAAAERRWRAGPPELPTWDDCADGLLSTYDEVVRCGS